jgi:hypothetical protein
MLEAMIFLAKTQRRKDTRKNIIATEGSEYTEKINNILIPTVFEKHSNPDMTLPLQVKAPSKTVFLKSLCPLWRKLCLLFFRLCAFAREYFSMVIGDDFGK